MKCACIVAASCLLLAQATAHAKSDQIACSLEIRPPSITVKGEKGWVPFVPFPLRLYSAGMSGGAPETLTILRGEPQPAKKSTYKTLYGFSTDEEKWLDCDYGEAGEISMSRRLDDQFTQCVITILPDLRGQPRRIAVDCQ